MIGVSRKTELQTLLSDLEERVNKYPRGSLVGQGAIEAWFCLALAYRRHAIKPVERIGTRVLWAMRAGEAMDIVDKLASGEALGEQYSRGHGQERLGRRRLLPGTRS